MTDLAKIESEYAALANPIEDFLRALKDNLGSVALTQADLTRIKMPGAGGTTWELPSEKGTEAAKKFEGVIIGSRTVRAYWKDAYSSGGMPPDCSSQDAVTGVGNPGGDCVSCPLAVFGSKIGQDGKPREGQACSFRWLLFILRPEEHLPVVLSAPPTSANIVKQYLLSLASKGHSFWQVGTEFSLAQTKSNDGIVYSQLSLVKSHNLSEPEAERARQYSSLFSESRINVGNYAQE